MFPVFASTIAYFPGLLEEVDLLCLRDRAEGTAGFLGPENTMLSTASNVYNFKKKKFRFGVLLL